MAFYRLGRYLTTSAAAPPDTPGPARAQEATMAISTDSATPAAAETATPAAPAKKARKARKAKDPKTAAAAAAHKKERAAKAKAAPARPVPRAVAEAANGASSRTFAVRITTPALEAIHRAAGTRAGTRLATAVLAAFAAHDGKAFAKIIKEAKANGGTPTR